MEEKMAKQKLDDKIIKRAMAFGTEWPNYLTGEDAERCAALGRIPNGTQIPQKQMEYISLYNVSVQNFSHLLENKTHHLEMIEAARRIATDVIVQKRDEIRDYMAAHGYTDEQMQALKTEPPFRWPDVEDPKLVIPELVPRNEAEEHFADEFSETALYSLLIHAVEHCEMAVHNSAANSKTKHAIFSIITDLVSQRWEIADKPDKAAAKELLPMYCNPTITRALRIREWAPDLELPHSVVGKYTDPKKPKEHIDITLNVDASELKRLPVTAQALLLYVLHKLTKNVSWRRCPASGPIPEHYKAVDITYDEYMTLRGLKNRKQAAETIRRDMDALQRTIIRARNLRIVNGDKATGEKRQYKHVFDSFGILEHVEHVEHSDVFTLFFSSGFVRSVSDSFLAYVPTALWKTNLRAHPGALSLGLSLWQLLTLPGSRKRVDGTRIISVQRLTEYDPTIPQLTGELPPKARKNPTRTFWEPLEGDLGELQDVGLIECELCDAKGKILSDDEKAAVKTWGVAKNLSMCIKMRDPYLTAFLEEQAAAEAKKRRRIAAAKRRKANDKAQNTKLYNLSL